MTLDLNKPLQRRDGKRVVFSRIVKDGTDVPLFYVYERADGSEGCGWVREEGRQHSNEDNDGDIINVLKFEYKLVYKDGAVVPPGWRDEEHWLNSKQNFDEHEFDLRLGWLKREVGDTTTTVFEPL